MKSKTTNNLNSNFTLKELSILAESKQCSKLDKSCLLELHIDKRTMPKKERVSYPTRYFESYHTNVTDNIFSQPNVSKFTLYSFADINDSTFFAEGKLSNLSAIFRVDTTEKDSKYPRTTYRVEFKDKASLLQGLQVYLMLASQSKDKILRSKLRGYFTALALL